MIRTLNAAEATERLRAAGLKISPETIRNGIEQHRFPFGDLIRSNNGSPVCFIYEKHLEKWIKEREDESEPEDES